MHTIAQRALHGQLETEAEQAAHLRTGVARLIEHDRALERDSVSHDAHRLDAQRDRRVGAAAAVKVLRSKREDVGGVGDGEQLVDTVEIDRIVVAPRHGVWPDLEIHVQERQAVAGHPPAGTCVALEYQEGAPIGRRGELRVTHGRRELRHGLPAPRGAASPPVDARSLERGATSTPHLPVLSESVTRVCDEGRIVLDLHQEGARDLASGIPEDRNREGLAGVKRTVRAKSEAGATHWRRVCGRPDGRDFGRRGAETRAGDLVDEFQRGLHRDRAGLSKHAARHVRGARAARHGVVDQLTRQGARLLLTIDDDRLGIEHGEVDGRAVEAVVKREPAVREDGTRCQVSRCGGSS